MNTKNTPAAFVILAALVAWFGLLLQAYLSFSSMLGHGYSVGAALAKFFSFFTILTNCLVAVCYALQLAWPASRSFFMGPEIRGGIAVSIAIVSIGYAVLLHHLQHLTGWASVANLVLHYLTPALFVLYWILFVPKGFLRWKHTFAWLLYPALYVPWALTYGAVAGHYPYPFLDVAHLGYPKVLLNCLGLLVIYELAGLLLVAADRSFRRAK